MLIAGFAQVYKEEYEGQMSPYHATDLEHGAALKRRVDTDMAEID